MISPSQLKNVLSSNSASSNGRFFFQTHIHLEGYVKRVMLIGLRLHGVRYDNAIKVVDSTFINTANLIEKVLFLINQSGKNQAQILNSLKARFPEFFVLKDVVLNFSAIYRNRLAHGTISELKDQEMIDLLCHVNQSFFKSFEELLNSEYGRSAFDKPSDWGAVPGSMETIEKTVTRLKLGTLVKKPLVLNEVKLRLAGTRYAKP